MPIPFVAPSRNARAFNCPLCGAYSQQTWASVYRQVGQNMSPMHEFASSYCIHCQERMFWYGDAILVPDVSSAPPPNEDLSDDIKADYMEAASIAAKSPRGAAALLRLCVQKLCAHLGEKGKNINADIGELVKKGLDVRVQQALDTVRVVGNEAVHPGSLDLNDDPNSAGLLFVLVNAIANDMITQPRLRDEAYGRLPAHKLQEIEARDATSRDVHSTE